MRKFTYDFFLKGEKKTCKRRFLESFNLHFSFFVKWHFNLRGLFNALVILVEDVLLNL